MHRNTGGLEPNEPETIMISSTHGLRPPEGRSTQSGRYPQFHQCTATRAHHASIAIRVCYLQGCRGPEWRARYVSYTLRYERRHGIVPYDGADYSVEACHSVLGEKPTLEIRVSDRESTRCNTVDPMEKRSGVVASHHNKIGITPVSGMILCITQSCSTMLSCTHIYLM